MITPEALNADLLSARELAVAQLRDDSLTPGEHKVAWYSYINAPRDADLPHFDTCALKYGGHRCTCGLVSSAPDSALDEGASFYEGNS